MYMYYLAICRNICISFAFESSYVMHGTHLFLSFLILFKIHIFNFSLLFSEMVSLQQFKSISTSKTTQNDSCHIENLGNLMKNFAI